MSKRVVIYQRNPIHKEKILKRLFTTPNILTVLRIIGTVLLPFCPLCTPSFYIVYTLSGVTDALDGFLARTLKQVSMLGARLDSVADILFYLVMLIKILPVLTEQLPLWLWIAVGIDLLIRAASYLTAFFKYRCFASLHTYFNKLTGLLIFMVPYVLKWQHVVIYYAVICAAAGLSSLEELLIHLRAKEYDETKKTIFAVGKEKA